MKRSISAWPAHEDDRVEGSLDNLQAMFRRQANAAFLVDAENFASRAHEVQPFLRSRAITVTHVETDSLHRRVVSGVHTGRQYHEFMMASQRDRAVRDSFQKMALKLLPAGANVLDLGAGTGIDAKTYVASGHSTFVYEPSEAMREFLVQYCRDEIARKAIIVLAAPRDYRVQAVTANFAVLNHFADHAALFEELSHIIDKDGFVLASMLSPFYLRDARYGWWWANAVNLVRIGRYPSPGESGIHRFSPRVVKRAAAPYFRLERLVPRGFGLATHLYMFLLFRRL